MKKSTKQLMAEYIRAIDCESCEVCAYNKKCNENFAIFEQKGEEYKPNETDCVNGIINFFEKKKIKEELQ